MAKKVHIVGAGLVGPLIAIYLARKGFSVALHERLGRMFRRPHWTQEQEPQGP